MKKILLYFFILIGFSAFFAANADFWSDSVDSITNSMDSKKVTQSDMLVGEKNTSLLNLGSSNSVDLSVGQSNGVTVMTFLKSVQNYILGFVALVTICVFIYIGLHLVLADGKSEEFTKAMKALLYVIIGLAVIPLSYIVIKIVTGFNF